jgi:hypothetical protein
MFRSEINNILQFGIILNNEYFKFENFIQIFGMASIYIFQNFQQFQFFFN